MLRKLPFICAVPMLVSGCFYASDMKTDAYLKTLPEKNADYGSYPSEFESKVKGEISNGLKDPYSARFSEFSKPRKEHLIENKKAVYGYSTCVNVNAKNGYGAYTGNHRYWVFIRNGAVIRLKDIDNSQDMFAGIIYRGHEVNCEDGQ